MPKLPVLYILYTAILSLPIVGVSYWSIVGVESELEVNFFSFVQYNIVLPTHASLQLLGSTVVEVLA